MKEGSQIKPTDVFHGLIVALWIPMDPRFLGQRSLAHWRRDVVWNNQGLMKCGDTGEFQMYIVYNQE